MAVRVCSWGSCTITAPVTGSDSQRSAAASPGSARVLAGRGRPGRTANADCPLARRSMKCAAVGAVSMRGRPPQLTKAAHSRLNQRPAVAATPVRPATIMDGMNRAAAAPMHATRAAENPSSRPRDDRRPKRTRLGEAAGAVSVMVCAHFDSWEAVEDAVPGLVLWWWGYARVGDFGGAGVGRCTQSAVGVTVFLVAAAAPAATTTGAATAAAAPIDPAAAAEDPAPAAEDPAAALTGLAVVAAGSLVVVPPWLAGPPGWPFGEGVPLSESPPSLGGWVPAGAAGPLPVNLFAAWVAWECM